MKKKKTNESSINSSVAENNTVSITISLPLNHSNQIRFLSI